MSPSLFLIYFVYGLSFFAMGLALLLEAGRSPSLAEKASLRFLGAFGLVHGTHEWLESYLLQAQSIGTSAPDWLSWLRLALLYSSFISLFLYAFLTLRLVSPKYEGRRFVHLGRILLYEVAILTVAILTYWQKPIPWIDLLDVLARYLIAVPAALLAALALYAQGRQSKQENRASLSVPLNWAAVGFASYGLAQVFVKITAMFPSSAINQETFFSLTGIPVPLIRTIASLIITVGLIRAIQVVEKERQMQLISAHQARLDALEQRDSLRREVLGHIVRAQEDERARIARELHDETAQTLTALSLGLGALRTKLKRADTIQMTDHLQDLARQIAQGLYHLGHDLRPAQLDDLGLVPALNFLFSQDCCPKGLEISFEVTGDSKRLDPLIETVLFRVAQESLYNVARHSGTNHARVGLRYECNRVVLQISDQGRGFDPAENFHPPRGWGLAGMRERVESIAGQFNLQSTQGQGTTVEAIIPMIEIEGKELRNGTDHIIARR
jgi:signal transduction histidine kinase